MRDDCTIIICTANRAASLDRTLKSIERVYGGFPCDTLVVDNGSTDNTAEIAAAYRDKGVRLISEPTAGLARARNTGLANSDREVVIYIDDDVEVRSDWLEKLMEPFADPKVAITGGELLPVWGGPRPDWLTDRWIQLYSVELKWSDHPREIRGLEWLCEGNIAFRRKNLVAAGAFPPRLGRVGPVLLSAEGVVMYAIRDAGGLAIFTPGSIVDHHISKERLKPKWLAARQFWQGVSMSASDLYRLELMGDNRPVTQWTDVRLPTNHKRWELLLNGRPDSGFDDAMSEIYHLGYALHRAGLITA